MPLSQKVDQNFDSTTYRNGAFTVGGVPRSWCFLKLIISNVMVPLGQNYHSTDYLFTGEEDATRIVCMVQRPLAICKILGNLQRCSANFGTEREWLLF